MNSLKNNNSKWLSVGVETSIPWPLVETKITFEGQDFILKPDSETHCPIVAIEFGSKGLSTEDAMHLTRRFFSALSWVENGRLSETMSTVSSYAVPIKKGNFRTIGAHHFDITYLPDAKSDQQKLALALYREALSLNSVPYQFLGFAKILNILFSKGPLQIEWINANLSKIASSAGLSVIAKLQSRNISNIGEHLYASGRCAVAHSYGSPTINPDLTEDLIRMEGELPLIRELAQIVIEQELKIKTRQTIWKEHLYELQGFKSALTDSLMNEISTGTSRILNLDEISFKLEIGLRQKESYFGLTELFIESGKIDNGILILNLVTKSKSVSINLGLDFKNERLKFDPFNAMECVDNGTRESLLEIIGFLNFQRDLIGNGSLQIKKANSEDILGHASAYLPVNIDSNEVHSFFIKTLEYCKNELSKRQV